MILYEPALKPFVIKATNSVPSQVVAVPDLFLTAVKLMHDKTGAQYLHAARDDSNNLFRLALWGFFVCLFCSSHNKTIYVKTI